MRALCAAHHEHARQAPQVITNHSTELNERLHVAPFHSNKTCALCPPNLCKVRPPRRWAARLFFSRKSVHVDWLSCLFGSQMMISRMRSLQILYSVCWRITMTILVRIQYVVWDSYSVSVGAQLSCFFQPNKTLYGLVVLLADDDAITMTR